MTEVATAHTSDLDGAALSGLRALLDEAFEGGFEDHDWEHSLGGVHCVAWHEGRPIGHAAVVARRLLHRDRALRTGYVEGMGVAPGHRRRGVGDALMAAAERVVRAGYEIGALSATEAGAPLYVKRGWREWEGRLAALTPSGLLDTPEDAGGVYVLDPQELLDPAATLACDWRDGELW